MRIIFSQMNRTKISSVFSFLLLFAGCAPDEVINLTTARELVQNYYEGGQFDEELEEIIKKAKNKFDKINFPETDQGIKVVIFDVDDTALLNYEVSKKMGFGYVKSIIDEWVSGARVPAIPQVRGLYNYLLKRGVKIIFLTGRFSEEYDYTFQNLINEGYSEFDTLIVRNPEQQKLPAVVFKSGVRTALTEKGYEIIGNVGDQWTDLEGPYSGIKVKIPNYLYLTR